MPFPLPTNRAAGQSGHVNDSNTMHAWGNLINDTGQAGTYYIRPDGNDSNNGKSWYTAWQTLAKAGASANRWTRIYLSPGTHYVNSTVTFSDGVRIIGAPITGDREQGANKTIITTSGGSINRYIQFWNGVSKPSEDNLYGGGVYNIHFNATPVTDAAIYARDANMMEIKDNYFTLLNQTNGAPKNVPLVRAVFNVGGDDGSWWNVEGNFTEHALLCHFDNGVWLNHVIVNRNICIGVMGETVTQPYIKLIGWGGRNVICNNSLEAYDGAYTAPAIQLTGLYGSWVYGNGFERLEAAGNRAINVDNCTSMAIFHVGGQSDFNGNVYQNGVRMGAAGMNGFSGSNYYMITPHQNF